MTERFVTPAGELILGATADALCLCAWCCSPLVDRQLRQLRGVISDSRESRDILRLARKELEDFFSGSPVCFKTPLLTIGTPFRKRVWEALLTIGRGQTVSYGDLAAALSTGPRAVGNAVGANPLSIFIPCHRVVPAGPVFPGNYAGGTAAKTLLLRLESKSSYLTGN